MPGLQDITSAELEAMRRDFDRETENRVSQFTVGPYFNGYARNIIFGAVPSGSYKCEKDGFCDSLLLLAFVRDFAAIFDSTNAIIAHRGQEAVDLTQTLQYKLLIVCGTFLKLKNQHEELRETNWIKETRSVKLDAMQKRQLVQAMVKGFVVAEDPNLMVIAIEFRLKPRVVKSGGAAEQGRSEMES